MQSQLSEKSTDDGKTPAVQAHCIRVNHSLFTLQIIQSNNALIHSKPEQPSSGQWLQTANKYKNINYKYAPRVNVEKKKLFLFIF